MLKLMDIKCLPSSIEESIFEYRKLEDLTQTPQSKQLEKMPDIPQDLPGR